MPYLHLDHVDVPPCLEYYSSFQTISEMPEEAMDVVRDETGELEVSEFDGTGVGDFLWRNAIVSFR